MDAEEVFTIALKLFKSHLNGDIHQEIAKCYARLGDLYCLRRNFEEGLRLHLLALDMRKQIFPDFNANPEVAASLNRVGYAYHVMKNREEARGKFDEAREIRTNAYKVQPMSIPHITTLYISYPSCLYSDEDMVKACEQYDHWQGHACKPHLVHATAMHRRGDVWFIRENWNQALQLYKNALGVRQQIETQSVTIAATHYSIGKCYVALNRLEDATKSFSEANRLRTTLLDDDNELDLQLATVSLKRNDFSVAKRRLNTAISKCSDDRNELEMILSKIYDGMSCEEIDSVVNLIWSIPADPFLLI